MAVLISIAVHETSQWIDELTANALRFSAASTRLIVHLNAYNSYADADIQRWNETARVGVASHRVPVHWGRGSILYAHVLAITEASGRWPACEFVVLQATYSDSLGYAGAGC